MNGWVVKLNPIRAKIKVNLIKYLIQCILYFYRKSKRYELKYGGQNLGSIFNETN